MARRLIAPTLGHNPSVHPKKVFTHITEQNQAPHSCEAAPGAKWIHSLEFDGVPYSNLRHPGQTWREYHQPLYAAYVYLKVAFDSVDRGVLWTLMKALGLLLKILSIIKALYFNTVSCVRIDGDTGDCFLIKYGVHQECILAPDCFDVAMDLVLDRSSHRAMHDATMEPEAFTDLIWVCCYRPWRSLQKKRLFRIDCQLEENFASAICWSDHITNVKILHSTS